MGLKACVKKHYGDLWWLGIFDLWTNRKELIAIIKDCWKTGGKRWWLHNLSCNLRRGRDPHYALHDHSDWGKLLFFCGVWLLDPTGKHLAERIEWHKRGLPPGFDTFTCGQWRYHPYAWVRKDACAWYNEVAEEERK